MESLLTALGLLFFLEGLPYLAFPDRMKRWIEEILKLPSGKLRTVGAAAMILGLILVHLGRRHGGP
ncbi:DUF2065 domain-containing protein [Desulfosoma caldarium]|uniref:DUF2065 domain-containing protein n=1 Tax=Desulfosoma caldarium TaxID=610254 RepID=A0A3N1ULW9_9BACT|nr:DUF2065 domain-containing protein [Desulfosoma caldarium]ROQ92214.1 hypothetical protein EDC27_1912 [Desulfosoma caldarium]